MRKNNSFKYTLIPFWTKDGSPMAYYALSEDDVQTKVTRTECLKHIDEPDNPYPQRWFVDEESGLVVRLPRNAKSEELARGNMRFFWRERKYQERKYKCVWKDKKNCDQDCEHCDKQLANRTFELDSPQNNCDDDESSEARDEPISDCDVVSVTEEKALLDTLYAALAALTLEERDLITEIFWNGKTERQLAPELGLKESKSVNKRKHRILEILRFNETLRAFFE